MLQGARWGGGGVGGENTLIHPGKQGKDFFFFFGFVFKNWWYLGDSWSYKTEERDITPGVGGDELLFTASKKMKKLERNDT